MGLVVTRRAGESVVIDGQIVVTIKEIRGADVRVNVDAPAAMRIYRNEISDRYQSKHRSSKDIIADLEQILQVMHWTFKEHEDADLSKSIDALDSIIAELRAG